MAKKQTVLIVKPPRRVAVSSYAVAAAHINTKIHGLRVLLKIIDAAQDYISPRPSGKGYKPTALQPDLFGGCWLYFPLADIEGGEGRPTNQTTVKKEIQALQKTLITLEPEPGKWISFPLLGGVEIFKGNVKAFIEPHMWSAVLDLTRGFRAYAPATAQALTLPSAIRFYLLFSQKEGATLTYTIEELRAMFGAEHKYPLTKDFIKKVIIPAKEELDATSPYSFEWEAIKKEGGRGNPDKKAITAIRFTPVHIVKNEEPEEEQQNAISRLHMWSLPREAKERLINDYGFSYQEYNNNRQLFDTAAKTLDLEKFLKKKLSNALRARTTPKAYIIAAIRRELKTQGISV